MPYSVTDSTHIRAHARKQLALQQVKALSTCTKAAVSTCKIMVFVSHLEAPSDLV